MMPISAVARPAPTHCCRRRSLASCALGSSRRSKPASQMSLPPRISVALRTCRVAQRPRCATGSNSSTYNDAMSEVVKVACPHDCPDTCAMLVTVDDGVATKIQGDPQAPFTEGSICTKVSHYLERTYAPDRLKYPMRRSGRKGEGKFERISWDEALDAIAARLKPLGAENPETILPCSYAGTMGMVQYSSMDRRFFHKLGASLLDRTLCSTAGKYGLKATL